TKGRTFSENFRSIAADSASAAYNPAARFMSNVTDRTPARMCLQVQCLHHITSGSQWEGRVSGYPGAPGYSGVKEKISGESVPGGGRTRSFGAELRHHDARRRRALCRHGQCTGGGSAPPYRNLHGGGSQHLRHGGYLFVGKIGGGARAGAWRATQR